MRRQMPGVLLLWVAACTDAGFRLDARQDRPEGFDSPTTVPPTTQPDTDRPVTATGETGDTGTPGFDCATQPVLETYISTQLFTEEDFDFHPSGMLVTPSGGSVIGLRRDGSQVVIAANVGIGLSGLRVLANGLDAVVGDQTQGSVERIMENGGVVVVQGGLTNPRAIAADSDGYIYVSENAPPPRGRVRMADPLGDEHYVIAEGLNLPNGLALSPDEQTLYVVAGPDHDVKIYAADRIGPGEFDTPRVLVDLEDVAFSLATDLCGFVYAANFFNGKIYRVAPDGSSITQIADLPGTCCFSGMRFGNGAGGFQLDHLFVTRRFQVFDLTVGIPGKPPIYPVPP